MCAYWKLTPYSAIDWLIITVFRAQESKAPVTYCDHALSGVCRPSVRPSVRQFTFSTSSPEPLDRFWWNLVWMKYSRSLISVVVFRPDPPRGGSRAGAKIGHAGSPSSKNFFFRSEGYSNKPNAWQWSKNMWEEVCYFWFHSEVKFLTRFWRLFGLSHFGVF